MGHSRPLTFRWWLARLNLLTALYLHFTLEHNRQHHPAVATATDPASAPRGRTFWLQLVCSCAGSVHRRLAAVRAQWSDRTAQPGAPGLGAAVSGHFHPVAGVIGLGSTGRHLSCRRCCFHAGVCQLYTALRSVSGYHRTHRATACLGVANTLVALDPARAAAPPGPSSQPVVAVLAACPDRRCANSANRLLWPVLAQSISTALEKMDRSENTHYP